MIFEDVASKLEKIGPFFSSFNPFPSLPSVATDDRKQFQCRKTGRFHTRRRTNRLTVCSTNHGEFKTANSPNFQANFPQTMAPFASSFSPRRANRPFVRLSPSECEFRSYFGRLVRLDGQIVFKKSSENLFVPFSHQTICPSETICSSRRFVRLQV